MGFEKGNLSELYDSALENLAERWSGKYKDHMFLGMLSNADDYEVIHFRAVGCDEVYPRDYAFLGYDVGYPASNTEAYSIICDCMFICRWHGCDEEGTLFVDDFSKLNENGLFDSSNDAYNYMVKYLNEDWSEKGDYYIYEVRRKNGFVSF